MRSKNIIIVTILIFLVFLPSANATWFEYNIKTSDSSDGNQYLYIRDPLIKPYNSFIEITYNESQLEDPISPFDLSVVIPIDVIFSTDVPSYYRKFWPINSLILFRQLPFPVQIIQMNITNMPDTVDVYLTSTAIYVHDIPFKSEEPEYLITTLVIVQKIESRGKTFTINLSASCNNLGRIKGTNTSIPITFSIGEI
jgi:hypothetical protein